MQICWLDGLPCDNYKKIPRICLDAIRGFRSRFPQCKNQLIRVVPEANQPFPVQKIVNGLRNEPNVKIMKYAKRGQDHGVAKTRKRTDDYVAYTHYLSTNKRIAFHPNMGTSDPNLSPSDVAEKWTDQLTGFKKHGAKIHGKGDDGSENDDLAITGLMVKIAKDYRTPGDLMRSYNISDDSMI
jgi:hypothetical protein